MSRIGPLFGFLVCLGLIGCGGGSPTLSTPTSARSLTVRSSAFRDGDAIPVDYSCDGKAEHAPALSWSGAPAGTKQFAIVVEDPDAKGFLHWLVTGIPADTTRVDGTLPQGAVEALNQFDTKGWAPVCPPDGKGAHHYDFTVYALDAPIDAKADDVLALISEHAIASGKLTGTFSR